MTHNVTPSVVGSLRRSPALVALIALSLGGAIGCGATTPSPEEEVTPSLEQKTGGLSSTDPIIGFWKTDSGYVTEVKADGNGYIAITTFSTYCYPIGSLEWGGIAYSHTDSCSCTRYYTSSSREYCAGSNDYRSGSWFELNGNDLYEHNVTGSVFHNTRM